jgi:hypothetical protein
VSTPNGEIGEGRLALCKEWHSIFLHCSTLQPTMVNVAEARTCVPGVGCRRPKRNSLVGNGWAWPGQVEREQPRPSRPRTPSPTNTRAAHTITSGDFKVQQAGWHKARRHGGFPRFASTTNAANKGRRPNGLPEVPQHPRTPDQRSKGWEGVEGALCWNSLSFHFRCEVV